jgi:hypothetical protein
MGRFGNRPMTKKRIIVLTILILVIAFVAASVVLAIFFPLESIDYPYIRVPTLTATPPL